MSNSNMPFNLPHMLDALDAHLETTYTREAPGAALLVSLAGEELYAKGKGMADLQTNSPITPDTTFRLASVSKQFTAMCVQSLAQQGLLRYSDPLQRFFPELPAGIASRVTLQHLLCHTSGLPDYEDLVQGRSGYQVSDEEVLAITAAQETTLFAPGSQFRYSNTGYVLLALVVERVSGMDFGRFLEQRIFGPLGMRHSRLYNRHGDIPERALGYAQNEAGEFVPADQGTCTATMGDGCIYTSVRDYLRWHRALHAGLVPALAQVYTPIPGYTGGCYGMGWFFAHRPGGGEEMFHTGNTSGFSNLVIRIPENKVLIAYFSNMANNPWLLTSFKDVCDKFEGLRTASRLVSDLLRLTR
jgi:CubicO group peptidase (beta-lactamase class C family)